MGPWEEFLCLIKPVAILLYFPSLHNVSLRKAGRTSSSFNVSCWTRSLNLTWLFWTKGRNSCSSLGRKKSFGAISYFMCCCSAPHGGISSDQTLLSLNKSFMMQTFTNLSGACGHSHPHNTAAVNFTGDLLCLDLQIVWCSNHPELSTTPTSRLCG